MQKIYNDTLMSEHNNNLNKEIITQNLVLSAHAELSSLIEELNYKNHHTKKSKNVDKFKILFESVDVIRYVMAILNHTLLLAN